jgi:hypothetical protein
MPPVTPEAKAQLAEKVVSLGVIAALKEVATISAEVRKAGFRTGRTYVLT